MTQSPDDGVFCDPVAARLAAAGAAVDAAESLIPYPVPGAKIGLANVTTLTAMERCGFRRAFVVALSRPVAASFLKGTFLSPAFIISGAAAVFSFLFMAAARAAGVFSVYGISMAGAVAHNAAQLAVVYFLFMRTPGIWALAPVLAAAGLLSGIATGHAARSLKYAETSDGGNPGGSDLPSPAREDVSWGRLAAAFVLVAASLSVTSARFLSAANLALAAAVLTASKRHTRLAYLRFIPAAAAFFALPAIFGGGLEGGLFSVLRIFTVFQISAFLFKKNPSASLPPLGGRVFKFFPLDFFAEVWNTSASAVVLAPSVAAALASVKPSGAGSVKDYIRRAADVLRGNRAQ